MNKEIANKVLEFLILVLIQVLVLNHINFLGYINPYIYISFIMFFPIRTNRMLIIALGFLLGLCVDIFSDSGGVHAAATVTLAYIRPVLLKFTFGMVYEHQTVKFFNTELGTRLIYISLFTVLHHFILFSFEVFNISKLVLIFQKTLFSSIFTILLCFLITILFSKRKK